MQVHPETPNPVDLLIERVTRLERRVAALEHPSEPVAAPIDKLSHPVIPAEPRASVVPDAGIGTTVTGAFSLFGAALLGVAGAYVLRAISGANLLPRGVVAGLAALYAIAWLLAAARRASQPLAAALFAGTSILILAPMLWETSIRFQAMNAVGAAGYLAVYAAIATIVGLRSARSSVFALAGSGSALIAVALCVATHSMALFAAVLLAMHAACELSSLHNRARTVRTIVSLCADFSVWSLLYIYSLPSGEQSGYPPLRSAVIVSIVAMLFAIEVAGLVRYAIRRAEPIAALSALQAMAAFVLLVIGLTWFLPTLGARVVGFLCLALAPGCYLAAYGPIRRAGQRKNFGIFIVWAFALSYVAVFLLVSPTSASMILGVIALAATLLPACARVQSIAVQGVISLCTAAFASGLLAYAFSALAGRMPGVPTWPVLLVAACALFAYAFAGEAPDEPAFSQARHLLLALLAAFSATALLVRGLVGLAALALKPDVFHVAVLRTLALCLMAAVLTWIGARFARVQMIRVAYVALGFAVAKLLFEDIRHGHMEFIAVSIVLVAFTFIGVARLARLPVLVSPGR